MARSGSSKTFSTTRYEARDQIRELLCNDDHEGMLQCIDMLSLLFRGAPGVILVETLPGVTSWIYAAYISRDGLLAHPLPSRAIFARHLFGWAVIIDELCSHALVFLLDDHVPCVESLLDASIIHILESPDLSRGPAVRCLDLVIDHLIIQEVGLEVALVSTVVLEVLRDRGPLRGANYMPEDVVLVISRLAVHSAQLSCALDTCRTWLLNINVPETFSILVGLDVELDGHHGDGLADEPADTLEGEDRVWVVGEWLVLMHSISLVTEVGMTRYVP